MKARRRQLRSPPSGPGARAEVAELVARLGCEVVEATTGDEVLEAVEREAPALVVLDVALADGSAYECCRALRERHGDTTQRRISTQSARSRRVRNAALHSLAPWNAMKGAPPR